MTWVFCAGMIRSGSTLQFQLASSIVEHAGLGRRVQYAPESEFDKVLDRHANDADLKVFKAHVCIGKLYELAASGQAKVVYSYRDIRDVAVSAMKKFDKTFSELLEDGWLNQAVTDFKLWTSMPNVLISKYEDFVFDIPKETSRINCFFGDLINSDDIKSIASKYGVDSQLTRISVLRSNLNRKIEVGEIIFDQNEQLHHNHIDDGAIGKWKQQLNQTQVHFLNCYFEDWLIETGYLPRRDMGDDLMSSHLIDVDELSNYWKLVIATEKKKSDGLNSTLAAERYMLQQVRDWAERVEVILRTERERAEKLRDWAEQTEVLLRTERERAEKLRDWAEQTEVLLLKEREEAEKLRDWAEQTEVLLLKEREEAEKLRDWAERTEALLRTERESSQQIREILNSRRKLFTRFFSLKIFHD